jgi:hypothetical protein
LAALRSALLLAARRAAAADSAAAGVEVGCAPVAVPATFVLAVLAVRVAVRVAVRDARLFEPLVAAGVVRAGAAEAADVVFADAALVVVAAALVVLAFDVVRAPDTELRLAEPELFVARVRFAGRALVAAAAGAAAGAAATGALATCPGAVCRPWLALSAGGAASAGCAAMAAPSVAHTSSSANARRLGIAIMTSRDPVERA